MKHTTSTTANGLCTPPCGSSQGKSTRFSLLTSFLLLFLMFVGSNAAWASTNYFTPGKTLYFHVASDCKNWGSNQFAALFYYQNNENKAYGYENENYSARQFVGGNSIGSSNRIKCTRINDDYYSVVIPSDGTANIGYVRLIHLNTDDGWCHQALDKYSADNFTGNKNCLICSKYGDSGRTSVDGVEEYTGGGECITSACGSGGGGDPEPNPEEYCSFTQGEPIYFRLNSGINWGDAGGYPAAVFYYSANSAMDTKTNGTNLQVVANQWIGSGNYTTMTSLGNNMWSITIPRNDIGYIQIVRVSGGDANYIWARQNKMSVENAGTNNCIFCESYGDSGAWETYGGGRTNTCGGGDPEPDPTTPTQTNWSLRGDMWLNGSGDWLGGSDSKVPHFMDDHNGNITCSFVFPNAQCRLTLCENGSDKGSNRCDGLTNLTQSQEFSNNKYYLGATGGIKKYTFTLNESTGHFTATAVDYPVQKTGWHVFMSAGDGDPTEVGTIAEETGLVISNVASGNHNLYITDGSSTTIAGINWFGGLYIDKSNSNVAWATQRVYYDSGKFSSTEFPIRGTKDATGRFKLNEASDIVIAFDGGKITINTVAAPTPANTYTVTIHPNPDNVNETIVRSNVPENSNSSAAALNLSSITYGNGTATWYTNEACTTPFSSVTGDMDLYAKWGVIGDYYYLVGDFGMHDYGTNWAYNSSMTMETEDGVASVTFIAPKGCNRFEILTSRSSWPAIANQGSGLIAPSTPTLNWGNGYGPDSYSHFYFELDAPKKVTIRYNGKVSVTAEDYDVVKDGWTVVCQNLLKLGNVANDHVDNADDGNYMNGYNMTAGEMDNNGELIIRDVEADTYKFWIGKHNTALNKQKQQIEVFGAAHVDVENSSLGTYGSLANINNPAFNRNIPQDDRLYRRVQFTLTQTADIKIAFDGGKITVNVLPTHTVTFDSNGGSAVASQTVFDGNVASDPGAPSRPGYTFQGWKLNDNAYNFSSAVTGNITLVAAWSANPLPDGDIFVFGAGGTNWVTGWTQKWEDAAYQMSVSDGVATKTFYNVSGTCLFKIHVKNGNPNEYDYRNIETYSDNTKLITSVARENENNNNIQFVVKSGKSANVTVHFNGHEIWLTSVEVFTVTFNTDGGTTIDPQYVEINQTATQPDAPTKEGYRFTSWDWNFSNPITENKTINAQFVEQVTVTFMANGETFEQQAIDINTTVNAPDGIPVKEGYRFTNWDWDFSNPITEDKTITAQFVEQVTVTFMANGAMFAERTIDKGDKVTALEEPTAPAKAFDGWWTDAEGGTQIDIVNQIFNAHTTLYAHWVDDPTYLQQLVDATDEGGELTLTDDFTICDLVIDKAITINGNDHSIGNLTVQMAGDLNLTGALTVNDFSIYGKAGNSSVHATSGQVRNADNLTANGNAYFYYTIEPGEHVQHGWYDFTVPFPVNTGSGIKGIQDAVLKADFAYGTDYAIIEHLGDKQAAGEYAYKKFQGVMDPCRLYSITLDDDYNYKTLRFQKTNDGALVAADAVTLNAYTGDGTHQNWNGVGNGTLHHANVGVTTEVIQVYQSGNNSFMAVTASSTSLAIGTAFMVQEAGTMTLGQATNALLSPRRAASVQQLTAIQIASEGQPFSDQLFISADETAGQGYTQGADVAKAGNIGNVNVPQIWTNAYNSKLCAHEAQLINGEAQYDLSLYAPANGTYTLTSMNIPDGYTLYLTQNGNRIWDLSESYVLDLTKGTATEYGLLLVENYNAPTGVEQVQGDKVQGTKVLRNGILYILRNGKVFNAQGARVE